MKYLDFLSDYAWYTNGTIMSRYYPPEADDVHIDIENKPEGDLILVGMRCETSERDHWIQSQYRFSDTQLTMGMLYEKFHKEYPRASMTMHSIKKHREHPMNYLIFKSDWRAVPVDFYLIDTTPIGTNIKIFCE